MNTKKIKKKVTTTEEMFLTGFNYDHSLIIKPNLNFDKNEKFNR